MATAFASTTVQTSQLEQLKRNLWNVYASLPKEQQREFLSQCASVPTGDAANTHAVAQPSMAQQTPRSMSYSAFDMTQLPTSHAGSMDRVRSAPAAVAMGRSISTTGTANPLQRRSSAFPDPCEELPNDYTFSSGSASMRRPSSLQPIVETSPFTEGMVEYTPEQYITTCIEPSSSPTLPLSQPPQPQHPRQLHVQLTPTTQWSPSLDASTSPSTPSTALMTPVTLASNTMSRQSSHNPQFFDEVSMLRVQSDSSSLFPVLSEDGSFLFPSDVDEKSISNCVDNSPFFNFAGSTSEVFLSTAPVSASVSALASSDNMENMPDLAEDMRRSASVSSDSNVSNASNDSTSSTSSRQSRRDREINAQATRKIAPAPMAAATNQETISASSNGSMMRIRSSDGSSKSVAVITKAPYTRPQHPKINCPHCNERPEGFRGTHELERHVQRSHQEKRKGYICIDASSDKKFLANCKHCRNKKVYGAYYNAAAHLRRAHFHPRPRGRKGKHDQKRGGIGGGDDPPMDYLKQNWICEVEVSNKQAVRLSPNSASESIVGSGFDTVYDVDAASYSTSQHLSQQPTTTDMSMSVDATGQYIDYAMCMTESEPMYDPTVVYTNEPNNSASTTGDINNFQFDAYMA